MGIKCVGFNFELFVGFIEGRRQPISLDFRRRQRSLRLFELRVDVINRGVSFREAPAKARILADDKIERRLKRMALVLAMNRLVARRLELVLRLSNARFRRENLRDWPLDLPVWRARSNFS